MVSPHNPGGVVDAVGLRCVSSTVLDRKARTRKEGSRVQGFVLITVKTYDLSRIIDAEDTGATGSGRTIYRGIAPAISKSVAIDELRFTHIKISASDLTRLTSSANNIVAGTHVVNTIGFRRGPMI